MPVTFIFSRPLQAAALAGLLGLSLLVSSPAFAHGEAVARAEAATSASNDPELEIAGVVEEIIIDDRVDGSVHRYRELRLADGSAIALRGAIADSLADGDVVALHGKRVGRSFDPSSIRARAKARKTSPPTGPGVEIEGKLAIVHSDKFGPGVGEFTYEVHEAGGVIRRLDLASLPPPMRWGMRISIGGRLSADGAILRPSRITLLDAGPAPEGAGKRADVDAKAASSALVILANFNNTPLPSLTSAQAQQVMATNADSVSNYFSEVSFGQQTFNVTVTNWVTINMSRPATCNGADWQAIGSAATAAATAANGAWNSASYGFVVYLFPDVPACGWNGLAYIGSPRKSYINGTSSFVTKVIAHEMGHNFGLLHAGTLDCGAATIGGSCTVSEYGDPWNTMGNQRAMHFTAQQKRKLNWISAATVPVHAAGSASYSLTPIESPGGSNYAIRIPTVSSYRTYWVEFRQPIGFDSALAAYPNNGAQIRVSSPFETLCPGCDSFSNDSELLDMTPETTTFTDSALVVGQSFVDATYGITISVISAAADRLSVQVSTGGSQSSTTTTLTSSPNPSTPGASVTFTATVSGAAPTGSVSFTDGGLPIANCSSVSLAGSGNSPTATCTTSALTPGTHGIVATYGGNGANAASSSSPYTQTVDPGPTTTGIASSANPSVFQSTVTFTASVSGSAPTGTVRFTDGGSTIPGCAAAPLGGSGSIRTATCATSTFAVGTHDVAATYSGDTANAGSSSAPLSQLVQTSEAFATANLITSFYVDILGRNPEAGAVDAWALGYFEYSAAMGINVRFAAQEMARVLFGGAEYAARARTDSQFIQDAYRALLHRAPLSSELASWLSGSWSRPQAAATFAESVEFGNYIAGLFPGQGGESTANFVATMYIGLLDRMPDASGLTSFRSMFDGAFAAAGIDGVRANARAMGSLVIASSEYQSKAPSSQTNVIRLYRGYLGRYPAANEIAYWSNLLDAHSATIETLIDSFAASPEFGARLDAYFGP